ncbi:glutathione S-transferase [Veronia nyctiphanis]|uniref:Glutathione S-transferase n=1 Tax=Veronia nyctiphanis TaxID=1278244 RepID=A0A4Q0YPB8_9GAMM|nr:glutathione S-transferase [Veronia nyctiphanis]RXJ72860.1 glutathione S-transferase [Veronia nyctiphanis]
MKLYDLELSGNCYKVRLFCALNNIPLDIVPVDYLAGEHKGSEYLAINPLGQLPSLDDNGLIIRDSQAILVYLAVKYDLINWWPHGAIGQALIMQWLSFSANEIARGPNDARLHDLFEVPLDVAEARDKARAVLDVTEATLQDSNWLVGDKVTLADIACFPYIALAHQGGVALDAYPKTRAWCERIKMLNGFITMPGIE